TLEKAFERIEARVKDEEIQERRGARVLSGRSLAVERPRSIGEVAQRPPVSGGAGRPLVVGAGSSGNATGVKIEVMQAGSVSVSFADLVAQGMPASVAATPDAVRLTNLGQPVSFQQRLDQSGTPPMP